MDRDNHRAMPPWTPDFGTYHAWLDARAIVVVTVDQAAVAGVGLDHPVLCQVMVDLRKPDPDGLVTAAERPALTQFEEELDRELQRYGEPWFVGSRTERGERWLWHYVPAAGEAGQLPGRIGGYEPHYRFVGDPQWLDYHENLAPSDFQKLLITSNVQLDQRAKLGDRIEVERVVDHTARFPDPGAARAGAAALAAAGFSVTQVTDDTVTCTMTHNLQGIPLERAMERAIAAVGPHGGIYDGWGAPVVTEAPATRRRLFGRK
jgi:hypothetical protein